MSSTMATTQVQSSELVGVPEDVSDIISILEPDKTKLTSMIGRRSITETLTRALEDELRQPGQNAAIEGAKAVPTPRDQPIWLQNVTQILQDTFSISGTSEKVKLYGRKSETNRQTIKAGLGLKQDLEYALCNAVTEQVPGTPTTPGVMGSVQTLIHPDNIQVLGTAAEGSTAAVPGTLTEDLLNSALQKLWEDGAETSVIMGPGPLANTVAGWAYKGPAGASRTVQQPASATKLVAHVDIYEGPFGGPQTVVKNRVFQPDGVMILDPDNFDLCTLRPWQRTPLAIVGDSREYQLLGEFTVMAENRKRAFLFSNVGQ